MKRATVVAFLLLTAPAAAQDAHIRVQPDKTIGQVSRYMTGACLEDVNHEVYGGLYSQMIFGESFQEPEPPASLKGFTAFGGNWTLRDGELAVSASPGPRLVALDRHLERGEVGVDVFLPGKTGGVAGLIVQVAKDGSVGPDTWTGYEIALCTNPPHLLLGRHRNNWEPIKTVPLDLSADRWIPLAVRFEGPSLVISVDGKEALRYEDRDHPLRSGAIGLRPFSRACRYRKLWLKTDATVTPLPFEQERRWDAGVSGMWRGVRAGSAVGHFALDTQQPFLGRQSQVITLTKGDGQFGVENRGLNRWGMNFIAGKPYEGYLWLRANQPADVSAALESADGKIYAEKRLAVPAGDWRRFDFSLTPTADDKAGRFALKLDRPGSVSVGHAFLQPGPWGRYKNLPVRKDVGDGLVAQGLTVLRYGGSMVNAPEYRWKKMIGPRDRRPPYRGHWNPHSSNGWGIVEFVEFAQAAGMLPIPAFNMDETPHDMADFVEYMNGPADSVWGKRRIADGHPARYGLKHIELGNEEAVDEVYWRRFKAQAEAVWAKDKDIILIVGDFEYQDRITDPEHVKGAPSITSLAAHRKILDFARENGRPVWFDVHIWNDNPRDPATLRGGIIGLRDFAVMLKKRARAPTSRSASSRRTPATTATSAAWRTPTP